MMMKNITAKILTAVQSLLLYPFRLCYVAILNVLLLALLAIVATLSIFTFVPGLSGFAEAGINNIRFLITLLIIPGSFDNNIRLPNHVDTKDKSLSFSLGGNGDPSEYSRSGNSIYLPHLFCVGIEDASFAGRVNKYADFIKDTIIRNPQLTTINISGHSMGGAILAAAIAKVVNDKSLEVRDLTFNLDIDRAFDNLSNVVDGFLGYGVFKPIFVSVLWMLGLTLDTEQALQKIIQETRNHKVNITITTCSDDGILGDGALTAANLKNTNPKISIESAIINVDHNSPRAYDGHGQLQGMDSNFDMKYHKNIYLALDFVLAVIILQLCGVFAMLNVAVLPLLVGPFFAAIMPQLVFSISLVLGLHAFTNACSFAASSFVIDDSSSYDLANREEANTIKKGYYSEVAVFSVLICVLLLILKIFPLAAMSFSPVLLLPVLFGGAMLLATFIAASLPLAADSSQAQSRAGKNNRGDYFIGSGHVLGSDNPSQARPSAAMYKRGDYFSSRLPGPGHELGSDNPSQARPSAAMYKRGDYFSSRLPGPGHELGSDNPSQARPSAAMYKRGDYFSSRLPGPGHELGSAAATGSNSSGTNPSI